MIRYCDSLSKYPKIVKCWDNNLNILSPREVRNNSRDKFHFKCNKCNHKFKNSPYIITRSNIFCLYCLNHKMCKTECTLCINKSIYKTNKIKYWDYEKNKYNPKRVNINNEGEYFFKCVKNHSNKRRLTEILHSDFSCKDCDNNYRWYNPWTY